jgi:hypothetical protein
MSWSPSSRIGAALLACLAFGAALGCGSAPPPQPAEPTPPPASSPAPAAEAPQCVDDKDQRIRCVDDRDCCPRFVCGKDPELSQSQNYCIFGG